MEVLDGCADVGRGGQVQCLGQVDEPPRRSPPKSGFQQFLSRFPSCRSGVHLTNLKCDHPSLPETFSPLFVSGQKS